MQQNSDLPAQSGLGSSSAFTVGFLHALYNLQGRKDISKELLAKDAIHVEQNVIKENVGSQDQIAAAFGGLNRIEFQKNGQFEVIPASVSPETVKALEGRLMLFFTGFARNASDVAVEQIKNIKQKKQELHAMAAMVPEAVNILAAGPARLNEFGRLLDESWKIKRGLSSKITNSHIDGMYTPAKSAGALGGKILGAGGGGFILL